VSGGVRRCPGPKSQPRPSADQDTPAQGESAALFERRALQLDASEQVDLVEGKTEALDGRLVRIGRGQTFEL
jgi:hypothetical protein